MKLLKRIWEKTILNSSLSALCGISRLTIKETMDIPDTVEIVEQIIQEAVEGCLPQKKSTSLMILLGSVSDI